MLYELVEVRTSTSVQRLYLVLVFLALYRRMNEKFRLSSRGEGPFESVCSSLGPILALAHS